MQNAFVTADRTTLVASSHRIYTSEKMVTSDGRDESDNIIEAAGAAGEAGDPLRHGRLAPQSGTVISAVMFGAIAGAGLLPLSRAACEAAIRHAGKGVEASLRVSRSATRSDGRRESGLPGGPRGLAHRPGQARPRRIFPPSPAASCEGVAACHNFQNRVRDPYLDRLSRSPISTMPPTPSSSPPIETGRFLALWMCYEDVIRVADLKTRPSRFERIREGSASQARRTGARHRVPETGARRARRRAAALARASAQGPCPGSRGSRTSSTSGCT